MQPFVVNRHGRLVFPSNFQPDLDFSVIETEEQLDRVMKALMEMVKLDLAKLEQAYNAK